MEAQLPPGLCEVLRLEGSQRRSDFQLEPHGDASQLLRNRTKKVDGSQAAPSSQPWVTLTQTPDRDRVSTSDV